jgi:hypothetical protein
VTRMCVDQPDFMRIVLLTEFLTHIHQRKSRTMQQVLQVFGTIYIEGHSRVLEITTDILNIVSSSNNCKYGSCGFCFDFSFHLVFTLNVTRFCGCVFIVIYEPSAGRRYSRMSAFFKARATKERVPLINA